MKVTVDKYEDLESKLNLYTPDDIYEDFDEVSPHLHSDGDCLRYNHEALVEFRKKLGGIKEACCGAEESIKALLQDYGDSMPSRQKEFWTKQATEIPHLVKSHENELRAAVKSVAQLVLASASNSSESDVSKASKDLRPNKKKQVLTELKSDEALGNNAGKLQNKSYDENWVKTEEPDDPTLLHDDHETIYDKATVTMEDCESSEKVESDLDKVQFSENEENDENGDNMEERQNTALLLDDYNSPNVDQCHKDEKVSWVGAITSSNTRQCLGSSPVLSPTNLLCRRRKKQVQNLEAQGEEMDDENSDSVQENVETVLLVEDQVKGDDYKVKALEIEVNNEECVKMKKPEDIVNQNNLDVKPSDATAATRAESTDIDAPIHEKVDASFKLCEKQIDKNPKVEASSDDGNADKALVNDEIKLLDDQEHTTAKMSSSKDTPASKRQHKKDIVVRFASKLEVEDDLDGIPEVSTSKPVGIDEVARIENDYCNENLAFESNIVGTIDVTEPNSNEDPKNSFIHASEDNVGPVESVIELVTSVAIVKFENMKRTLSEDLIRFDEQEILDQVEVAKYDDVTEYDRGEISEVSTGKPLYINKEVKLIMENVEANESPAPDSNITGAFDDIKPNLNEDKKNSFMQAPADYDIQGESDNESVAANAVAEFEMKKETWSDASVKLGKDLICFDDNEITSEVQVEVAKYDNVTENDNEECIEVTDENLSASFKKSVSKDSASFKESVSKDTSGAKEEPYDYDETSGEDSDNLFNIEGREDILLHNQEDSDGGSVRFTEEIHDDYEESAVGEYDDQSNFERENNDQFKSDKEIDDQLFYEVNKKRFNDDIPSLTKNSDAAFEDDDNLCKKSAVIKMLFKGTFVENSVEILKNLNMFSKIKFGNSDANGLEANIPTPESQNCVEKSTLETLVEETGLNAKESEASKGDILEEGVAIVLEMVNTGIYMFRAVNLMLSAVLAVWFTDFHRQVCLKQPDVHTPVCGSVPIDNLDRHVLKDQHEVHGDEGPESGAGPHHVNNLWNVTMIPKPMKMHKWFDDKAELKEEDDVYFRKFESEFSSKWIVGKVLSAVKSKDGVVGKCTVQYQSSSEDQPSYTDRAARSLIKLFNSWQQEMVSNKKLIEEAKVVNTGEDIHWAEAFESSNTRQCLCSKCYDMNHLAGLRRVKNCINCCCVNHCLLLTGHEGNDVSRDHLEAAVEDKFFNKLDKSWNEFEDYEQDVLDTLPLMEDKLMLLLCPVNTDVTTLETEPDASVDSSFSPELYGKGHSLGQSGRYYKVRIRSRYSTLKISITGILF